jgi:PEP-CTERM/exosortase A-associated glycosyltransferase
MTLRVLHVLDHSIPLQSGYTFRTRAILREQRRLGWETFHLTSPKHAAPGPDEEEVDGLRFFRTRGPPRGPAGLPGLGEIALMRATARRLAEVARRVQPHLIHAHSPVLNALPALWVGRRLSIPVVYEVRGFWEDAAVDHGTAREWGIRYRLTRALETYALRRADHVTTICEGLKADILRRGIDAARLTVIPNAIDVGEFRYGAPRDEALKNALGLAGCTVIGFIGSFYAYEGLDLLIEALPRLLQARPESRLLLVGGGPQEQALRAAVTARGLDDAVVFTGRVPHGDVQRYYSVVDVFAYPRHRMRLTELVTPLKPLEAMAQGHLLVASDVGGHRELIRDGRTGFLFPAGDSGALADTLLRVLSQPQLWPDIRKQGRAFVETERAWAKSAAGYVPAFTRLAAPPAAAREAHT